jgi:tetratricopeptide (TPR) repeat protein
VDPADALASLLLTAGLPAAQVPPGLEARAARWRDHVAGKKILLVLDDAAGHEQVRSLLPGTGGSLVLVTSRRRLTALEDAMVISLDTLAPAEAATLLARLAGRPELAAGDAAVGEITRLCGYLPLAIGMLARQLRHHPTWTAASVAAELAGARDRLALMHAENLSVAAAFALSYADLTEALQRLFRRLGLLPGPSFDDYAAAALDATSLDTVRRRLGELYDQHLLTEPAPGRYQLHDLLREHARALADADGQTGRAAAATRLLDYYLHTAAAADQHMAAWVDTVQRPTVPGSPPACAPVLSTQEEAAAWLEAERPNLQAAAEHAAAWAMWPHTIALADAMTGFLRLRGYVEQRAVLHRAALAAALRAGDRTGQARATYELGHVQRDLGDLISARASYHKAIALFRDLGDRPSLVSALGTAGFLHSLMADYPAAAATHQEALALARSLGDQKLEADQLNDLATVARLTGDYAAAIRDHQQAVTMFRDLGLARDQADALNRLGIAQRKAGHYQAAATSQQQSLDLMRNCGSLAGQGWALNDLGLVHQETGDYQAAAASHQQTLALFRDLHHPRGQADALNSLGELSSRIAAPGQAREHHTRALAIAQDLGMPLEEARALEGIGRSHLLDGNPGQAAPHLSQALAIYQRIGAPDARRVQETLQQHGQPIPTLKPS